MQPRTIIFLIGAGILGAFIYLFFTMLTLKKQVNEFKPWQIQATSILNAVLQNAVSKQELQEAITPLKK